MSIQKVYKSRKYMYLVQFSLLRPSTMQHKRGSRCLERSRQINEEEVEASRVNRPQRLGMDTDDMGGPKTHFKGGKASLHASPLRLYPSILTP